MIKKESRNSMRVSRHERIRKTMMGTSAVPRLCVFRSNTGIYAQIIDDETRTTLVSASSLDKVFDRGGYLYHGRVAALADAARENGLEF